MITRLRSLNPVGRRVAATALGAALATSALATVTAPPAQAAASQCKTNYLSYQPKGFLAIKVNVTAELCVRPSGDGYVLASGYLFWDRGTGSMGDGFDRFDLQLRLERSDAVVTSTNCTATAAINRYRDSFSLPPEGYAVRCGSIIATKGSARTWSADGQIIFNYNNDGKGDFTSQLTGSPLV
ncbi:hypothetical protein ACIBF1_42670 [Spirillospora sp. NPDC050679]